VSDPDQDLTVEEQVALTSGHDVWHTVRIDRVGLPAVRVTDGPTGARGPNIDGDDTSACFPVGTALGATWDLDLIAEVGRALASEARAKGAGVLLGPTVNLHRHPLAGRNFECYSEDPFLSARIAVAFVGALQAGGVGACIKHFVANDSEFRRHTISSEVDERTLRELYLVPFEAAVREAGTWSVMSAYNRVNGAYACDNEWLLTTVLRDEWGFDGAVISDWGGTMSTERALGAGLDLEMPGPGSKRGRRLRAALDGPDGDALHAPLAAAAANVARLARRAAEGEALNPGLPDDQVDALARRAAAQCMVLLRNEGAVLPLDPATVRIAVIGPNAEQGQIQGGGSSQVRPHHAISPLAGIRARLGDESRVRFEQGCSRKRYCKSIPKDALTTPDGEPGVGRQVLPPAGSDGPPASPDVVSTFNQRFYGGTAGGSRQSVVLSATYTPTADGLHTVGLAAAGVARVSIDGAPVVSASSDDDPGETFFGWGSHEQRGTVELQAGRPVALVCEFDAVDGGLMGGVRLGIDLPVPADRMGRAVAAAAEADVAVVVVGLDGEWETEGTDRVDMHLPGGQDELVAAVAAANPRTVVVLNVGSPVLMPWVDDVAAVVQAWYPGQDFGTGLADVLFGDVDPSGRLPTTFPRRIEDTPAFATYPGSAVDDTVHYEEGVFMGYRHYDEAAVEPRFPFGHGLSYTSFSYGGIHVGSSDALTLAPSVSVTNTGDRAGVEVVQCYVAPTDSSGRRPPHELKGFARVTLAPGETADVTIALDGRSFASWDDGWRVDPGRYEIRIGSSSRAIRAKATVEISEGATWAASDPTPTA